jgi:hypothetical protein
MTNLFDPKEQNKAMQASVQKSISEIFPIEMDGKRLELKNITIEDNLSETDFPAQKETKLNRKS